MDDLLHTDCKLFKAELFFLKLSLEILDEKALYRYFAGNLP